MEKHQDDGSITDTSLNSKGNQDKKKKQSRNLNLSNEHSEEHSSKKARTSSFSSPTKQNKDLDVSGENRKHVACVSTEYGYVVDVLCRQPIKLFQVVSTSEFHEY